MLTHFPPSMQRDFERPFKCYSHTSSNLPIPFYGNYAMSPYLQQTTEQVAPPTNTSIMGLPMSIGPGLSQHSTSEMKPTSEHLTDISDSMPNRSTATEEDHNGNPIESTSDEDVKLEPQNSISSSSPPPVCQSEGEDEFKMPPKKRPHQVAPDQRDSSYWEKRRKNNESAKRSRDARRMKEEQIAMRVVYLEQENLQLRTQVVMFRKKIEEYRYLLYNA